MAKQRQPIREVIDAGDHQLVFEVERPKWRNRDLVMKADPQLGALLEEVFDDAWRDLNPDSAHEVARSMFWDYSVRKLLYIGEGIRGVRAAESGSASVIDRIKLVEEYDGALMEARVAHLLHQRGVPFRFNPPLDVKCHDIDLLDGSDVAIEVKTVEHAVTTKIAETMTAMACAEFLHQLDLVRGKHFAFRWNGDRVIGLDGGGAWENAVGALGKEASSCLIAALRSDAAPRTIELNDLGTLEMTALPLVSRFEYFALTMVERAEHRVYRSIRAAATQLPEGRPGIVVLCPDPGVLEHKVALDAVEEALEKHGEKLRHVSNVVVLSTVVSVSGPKARTEIVGLRENPTTSIKCESSFNFPAK